MRDFTQEEMAIITEKFGSSESHFIESSYVGHHAGDRLQPTPSGFSVYFSDSDEGFLFTDLQAAINKMLTY